MSQSLKLKDNNYWDSTGIVHNKEELPNFLFDKIITYYRKINIQTINEWYDTGLAGENIHSGTYIMEVYISNVNSYQYRERLSGVIAWYKEETNSGDYDEIPLSKSGKARNGHNIKLRILRNLGDSHIKLQISDNIKWDGECEVIFKFRKVI